VNGNFPQAVFEKAELTRTNLSGATLEEAYFGRALALGASFVNAKLREADFSHADVSGADFSGAGLHRTRFHLAKHAGAVLPRGAGWLGDDEALARLEMWQPRHGTAREEES
jgi:uncharacterized protein YjbI with pentapeptide repeats